MDQQRVKLGVAPINWSNDDLPELGGDIPLERCLSEMQEAGYEGTELGHKFPTKSSILKPLLSKYGLVLASMWHSTYFVENNDLEGELSGIKEKLEFLSAMGAGVINLAECSGSVHGDRNKPLSSKPVFSDREWDRLIMGLKKAGELCDSYEINIAFHHHMGTGVQTEDEIDRLMTSTLNENVYLCADTGHMVFAGVDPLPVYERYIDRIRHIHLKDIRKNVMTEMFDKDASFLDAVIEGVFTVPGDGMIDFKPIFDLIKDSDYNGWMVVEAEGDPAKFNPLQYSKIAKRYISELINV